MRGDFNDAQFTYADVTTMFSRRDGKFIVRTDGPDGALADYEVKFVFGVAPLEQYLLELPGGRLQALTIAWDTRAKAEGGQRWFHLHPDETIKAGDPLHWTGLQQNWNFECADCHSTNLVRNYDPVSGVYRTTYSEIDVSCESCHGPGSAHAAWARKDAGWEAAESRKVSLFRSTNERALSGRSIPRPAIVRAARRAQTTVEIETCAHCHSRRGPIWSPAAPGAPIGDSYRVALLDDNLYFPDGQIRDEVYEYGSFLQSRMFHAGVTCSDCHEPHSLKLREPGNGVCLQCHAAEKFDVAAHHRHAPDTTGAQCVVLSHAHAHLHGRRSSPRPQYSHSSPRSQREAGDAERLQRLSRRQVAAMGRRSDQLVASHARSGLPALRRGVAGGDRRRAGRAGAPARARGRYRQSRHRARERGGPPRSHRQRRPTRSICARCCAIPIRWCAARRPGPMRGAAQLRLDLLPLLDDPVRDVRLEATQTLATAPAQAFDAEARRRLDKGIDEYIASQRSNSDRPEAHHNLGILFMELGRAGEAEAEFKAALALDPNFTPAAVTLADLYRSQKREAEAEPVLRAALSRDPSAAAAHFALGLWLVRAGRHEEAWGELKKAAELAPENAHFGYVLGVAVASAGDRAQGVQILRNVLRGHPYDRETLSGLASFEAALGHRDEALTYASRLAELEPQDPNVQALRGAIAAVIGQRGRAATKFSCCQMPPAAAISALPKRCCPQGARRAGANVQRRLFLSGTVASCAALLTGCAGISTATLDRLGSQVVHADVNFKDIYAYAERSNTAYLDKRTIKSKYPLTVRINSPDGTHVRYFLERDDKTRTQIITVRGTHGNKNLAEDLEIVVREDRKVDIPVHSGFDSDARAIYADVKPYLQPGYKTYVTGHSLGGAAAAILAIYLVEDGFPVERVVTFGQPRFTTVDGVKPAKFPADHARCR